MDSFHFLFTSPTRKLGAIVSELKVSVRVERLMRHRGPSKFFSLRLKSIWLSGSE